MINKKKSVKVKPEIVYNMRKRKENIKKNM